MSIHQSFEKTLETLLLDAGLSEKESRIYRVLLEKGTLSTPEIVKISQLKKGITYNILYKLTKEALVTQFTKDNQLFFQPSDPEKLKNLIERRKKAIEDVSQRIDLNLPELKSMYKLSVGKPTIQYFEGEEGIRAVFEDIYAKKKQGNAVWGCVDFEKSDEAVPSYIVNKLIPKRIKNKLLAISFFADSPLTRKLAADDKKQIRRTVLVSKEEYPLPAEIDVYEDKIAMLSFSKGEFIGILIENEDFAQSLKSIFRLAFHQFPNTSEIDQKARR